MREKLYFEVDDEGGCCYPIEYFEDRIIDSEKKINLEVAKRDFGSGTMWCKIQSEFVETGDGVCGKCCKDYNPRNKISGRCKDLDNSFTGTGDKYTLTKKGLISTNPKD